MNTYVRCSISGEMFSPLQIENKFLISFYKKNEKGDIGTIGMYSEKPIPEGRALLEAPSHEPYPLKWMVDFLKKAMPFLKANGVERIALHIDVPYDQGDDFTIEFDSEILSEIASMKIPFSLSCYKEELVPDIKTERIE